eukprot:2175418-Alexandrium_andersonii.AAC.1
MAGHAFMKYEVFHAGLCAGHALAAPDDEGDDAVAKEALAWQGFRTIEYSHTWGPRQKEQPKEHECRWTLELEKL